MFPRFLKLIFITLYSKSIDRLREATQSMMSSFKLVIKGFPRFYWGDLDLYSAIRDQAPCSDCTNSFSPHPAVFNPRRGEQRPC